MTGKHYPQSVRDAAVRLYQKGHSTYEVADVLGCTRPSVCNWLKSAGVDRRTKSDYAQDPEERFWSKVDTGGDCWEWQGGTSPDGYGKFWWSEDRPAERAHRVAYGLVVEDPGDMHVCHSCDNELCCNPDHLWLGTWLDNTLDCIEKERHSPEILYLVPDEELEDA